MRVHPDAAATYASARGLSAPVATDELLRLLLTARFRDLNDRGRVQYRYRSRADRLDVQAIVDTRPAEPLVIAVTVRAYGGSDNRRKQWPKSPK